jgi:NADPH:quinone reductase-like Zn-dependent oxidoreductase
VRAVVITRKGGPEVLEVQERPSPTLGAGQVRIQVAAAGVNFADTMARVGLYEDAPPLPAVVGYEVAGTVTEVAPDVTDGPAVGDRVMGGTRFGGYAEEIVVGAADAIALPDALSFEEGAAIPVNYSTAWAGLHDYGAIKAGDRVLIQAAAGGVGIAATQIAVRAGAVVSGTASPAKHDAIRAQGVTEALDYRNHDWYRGLPPFDIVMDAIGGRSFGTSYDLLRPGGRLIAFGASSVMAGEKRNLRKALPQALRMMRGFDLIKQMGESKTVVGLNMLRLWDEYGSLEPWITPLQSLLASGELKPVVSDVVPFDRAADAHRILGERRNVGKVVLVP